MPNDSRHYGEAIIASHLGADASDEALVRELHERLYQKFVEPFDAVDNGVNQYPPETQPAYARPYDIFAQIDDLNPSWNEKGVDPDVRRPLASTSRNSASLDEV